MVTPQGVQRQSARMSKIKNGGLDQYGAGQFDRLILLYSQKNAGLKGLINLCIC